MICIKRVALYARVSTDIQAEKGESIGDQLQALEKWANNKGYIIIDKYVDAGYSAKKSYRTRPSLMRLLDDVQANKIDIIIFTKLDRWSRRNADYYKLQDILEKHNVSWNAILEDYDTTTSDGRLRVGIMLSVNQHEAERTSDRIKFTFQEKRKRGELISGNLPRGYMIKDKKPVKDPQSQDIINLFWQTYLNEGYMSAMRKTGFANSTCSFFVKNAMSYSGLIQGIECEPYITRQQAEFILSTRKKRERKAKTIYLFSGLIYCKTCGKRWSAHKSYYKKNGVKTESFYTFYNCNNKYKPESCTNRNCVSESSIESFLLDNLDIMFQNTYHEAVIKSKSKPKVDVNKIRNQLEQKKGRLLKAYMEEIISIDELKEQRSQIDLELSQLEEPREIKDPEDIKKMLPNNWREIYNQLDAQHRRTFWLNIIDKIYIDIDRCISFSLRI